MSKIDDALNKLIYTGYLKGDRVSLNKRTGRFKTRKEAEEVGESMGLTAYKRMDGSWDLE